MSLPARLLGANPSIQVSSLLSGSLSTPSAKQAYTPITGYYSVASAQPSGVSSVTFSNIPSFYSHLEIKIHTMSLGGSTGNDDVYMYFNTYGVGTYATTYLGANIGTDTEAGNIGISDALWASYAYTNGNPNNRYSYANIIIPNYSSTSQNKTMYTKSGTASDSSTDNRRIRIAGGVWNQTSAISSITIFMGGVNFKGGTRIDLYAVGGEG